MSADGPSYRELLPKVGLAEDAVPALLTAEAYSHRRLREARTRLSQLAGSMTPGIAVFAFGSLGRLEASACSDLDLGVFVRLSDPERSRRRIDSFEVLGTAAGNFRHPGEDLS